MVCGNESTPTGKLGARFAKWRAVITIGDARPSRNAIVANAHALARYAALCQESGLVPIVEPEVLRDGIHDLDRCHGVTGDVLAEVFAQLDLAGVDLGAMVLKPSMVLPGSAAPPASIEAVAAATMDCLRSSVPTTVAGVAFLSGRQTPSVATEHLATMVRRGPHPWPLTFSYGRAIQNDVLRNWAEHRPDSAAARTALLARIRANAEASLGRLVAVA